MAKVKQTISLDKDLYEAANRAAGLQMLQTGQSWTVSKVINEALDLYLQHLGVEVVPDQEILDLINERRKARGASPYNSLKSLELDKRSKITKGMERTVTNIGNTEGLDEFTLDQEEDGKA